jgi:hypothetical protein
MAQSDVLTRAAQLAFENGWPWLELVRVCFLANACASGARATNARIGSRS